MAYLSPPFILCPLSDRKELVGIKEDQSPNKVIITIGKNIAIRYHVLEQKQEISWTSSRHWITSPVIYCSDFEKYGTVIDHNIVALWDEQDTTLSHLKKFKFSDNIVELMTTQNMGTLVILCNGNVIPLSKAEKEKVNKLQPILDATSEIILNVEIQPKSDNVFILSGTFDPSKKATQACIVKRKQIKVTGYPLSVLNKKGRTKDASEIVYTTEITMENKEIIGHCVAVNESGSFLLYLCDDGFLYKKILSKVIEGASQEKPEGVKIACVSKFVSSVNPVVMKVMEDCSSLIIYGSDPSEEGAVVFIYDINYDLFLSKQSLKLYATPPIMETIGQSIFVPVSLHILVMNFRVRKSLLSSVVGQHQLRPDEEAFVDRSPFEVKGWELEVDYKEPGKAKKQKMALEKQEEIKVIKNEHPTCYETILMVKSLENDGQPESIICKQTILPAVEKKNLDSIEWLLNYFNDIPELHLVQIIAVYLELLKCRSSEETHHKSNGPITNGGIKEETKSALTFEESSQLNRLLLRQFDSFQLTKCLKAMDFQLSKRLLNYIIQLLETSWDFGFEGELPESHWIKWTSAILDAQYTKFILNDELDVVNRILSLINEKSIIMDSILELEPLLLMTVKKTQFESGPSANSRFRTEIIEFI